VDEESEQTIVVEFIQDGVVLDSRRYADMDEIPAEVEIGGARYSTIGADAEGRMAWHRMYAYRDDAQVVYHLNVVDTSPTRPEMPQ
jgi:hypothetical protein